MESVSNDERKALQSNILSVEERLKFARSKMGESEKQHLNPMNLPYWLDDEIPKTLEKLAKIVSKTPNEAGSPELPKKEDRVDMIVRQLDKAAQVEVSYEFKNRTPNKVSAMAFTPIYDALVGLYGSSEEAARRIAILVDTAKRYALEVSQNGKVSESWAWELGVKKAANEALTDDEKKAFTKAQNDERERQSRSTKGRGMILTPSTENMLGKLLSSVKDIK